MKIMYISFFYLEYWNIWNQKSFLKADSGEFYQIYVDLAVLPDMNVSLNVCDTFSGIN